MTKKKKKSVLPNIEVLIILVLVCSFIMMAVMRCNETKAAYEGTEEAPIVEQTTTTTNIPTTTTATNPVVNTTPATPQQTTPAPPPIVSSPTNTVAPTTRIVSRLFVTLENLNLRTGPHLDSTIVAKLKLYEEVMFMNEVTDFSQKISLGPEIADDPWIKVKSLKGHVGWVYGAGVHYYKKRRLPAPLEEFGEREEER